MYFSRLHKDAVPPIRMTEGSAGFDIYIYEDVTLEPNEVSLVGTGIKLQIPAGNVGLLNIRSSMAKEGIVLANSVGIIDSDYRGELKLLVRNTGDFSVRLAKGSRIAQLVIVAHYDTERIMLEVDELEDTKRSEGGFGSTNLDLPTL